MWDLKRGGLRRCRWVLLTFSDFTTAIRSMMSLNSSLYLAAKATFAFQLFTFNKFLSSFWGGADGRAERSKVTYFRGSHTRGDCVTKEPRWSSGQRNFPALGISFRPVGVWGGVFPLSTRWKEGRSIWELPATGPPEEADATFLSAAETLHSDRLFITRKRPPTPPPTPVHASQPAPVC